LQAGSAEIESVIETISRFLAKLLKVMQGLGADFTKVFCNTGS
jgi:hypothetical protein